VNKSFLLIGSFQLIILFGSQNQYEWFTHESEAITDSSSHMHHFLCCFYVLFEASNDNSYRQYSIK